MNRSVGPMCAVLVLVTLAVSSPHAGVFTIEERITAQESIERVYAAHRTGSHRGVAKTAPSALLREKVRTYLEQTVALESYWNTPVTSEMIDRELNRMIRQTLMPERLDEIFAALGNDPVLIRESLVQPVLVNRLARNFFERDERIHGATFSAPKVSWDEWWAHNRAQFDAGQFRTSHVSSAPIFGAVATRSGATERGPCAPADTWDNGSLTDGVDPRRDHTAIWTGSEMIVWGGHWSGLHRSGVRYDPATDTWSPVTQLNAPSARTLHTAVWTGTHMALWGGSTADSMSDSGALYDPVGDSWTAITNTSAPAGRWNHTAIWTGSELIVWGGTDGTLMDTGGRYDPSSDTWTSLPTAGAPSPRQHHTAVWAGGKMIVWGGDDGSGPVRSGGAYDPITDTWTTLPTLGAPLAASFHAAASTGANMFVWGAGGGSLYLPGNDRWFPMPTAGQPSTPREGHSMVFTGDELIVWGGDDNSNTNTGGEYNIATRTWTPTALLNAPVSRSHHTAVWTGSHMIVWGAVDNTGGRYDPSTDSWTPTSTGSGPPAPRDHTAVWTGNRMIVWGGDTDEGYFHVNPTLTDEGYVYDPILDSWSATTLTNAPTARSGHVSVWTGDEMLVYGGDPSPLGTVGGRYDPVADTWSPMSIFNTPSEPGSTAVWTGSRMFFYPGFFTNLPFIPPWGIYDPVNDVWTGSGLPLQFRRHHTAVWTGERMIVWGGRTDELDYLNDGGVYDPVTDTWTPVTSVGAPSARAHHTAVWTGDKMIVWGGLAEYPFVTFDDGAAYDPVTDQWTPVTMTGGPAGRLSHTAVWTGREMVVWGGVHTDDPIGSTGGRYDPVTDTWSPTQLDDAPAGRHAHTAVWTGNYMLVWGSMPNGGRYVLGDAIDDDGDGFSECGGDCNDGNALVFPGAVEICDGLDNDCGGVVDELDADTDGFAACMADCNDADPGAHAVPVEATDLFFTDEVTLTWVSTAGAAGPATVHDIAIGLVSELPVGSGISESCVTAPAGTNTATHLPVPLPGDSYWYLVRGRNSCASGTYGDAGYGIPRVTEICP